MARLLDSLHRDSSKAFEISGLLGLGFVGAIIWIYRSHGYRLLSFHASSYRLVPKNGGLVAVEWIGLMVAWLAFGPEVARRHMCVLLLLHSAVLSLLASPESRFHRKPLVTGLVVWQLGLRLPPSRMPFFPHAGHAWNGVAGPSWCLLFLYASFVWSALEWAGAPDTVEVPTAQHRV